MEIGPDHQPALSLTGAPMPMVIGAYVMAQRLGCPAYYLNTAQGQILDLAQETSATPFTLHLSVADYQALHGQRWRNQHDTQARLTLAPPYDTAVQLLLADLPSTTALLNWLTERRNLETPQRHLWRLGPEHWRLLEQLAQLGLCQNLGMTPRSSAPAVRFSVNVPAHRHFLKGIWLELAVAHIAHKAAIFDECFCNLIIGSGHAQRETDFVGVRRGQGLIASGKTGRRFWDKAHLDELGAVARSLGDTYCTRLFITGRFRPPPGSPGAEALPQFANHAANGRIVIVSGEELPHLAAILQREIDKPKYARR